MSDSQNPTPLAIATAEGADAKRLGVPVEHNPYEAGTNEYDAWERAWEETTYTRPIKGSTGPSFQ